ncbi:peptidase [Streptomyces niveus]|uniref:peptidase n=1 Tax=Streptomyces niveus TaxID=193462 RepID=UPI00363642C8
MAVEEAGAAREVEETGTGAELGGADAEAGTLAAAALRYPVAPGYRLNVRSGPGTNYQLVRVLLYNATVPINCQKRGESVSGPYGTSNIWDNIANGEFVADAYVKTGSDGFVAPRCA